MEVELLEVRDFLAQQIPFSLLTEEQLQPLPEQMAIRYLRRGNPFPPVEVEKDYLYIIRQGAVEIRGAQQELIDKLAEGDVFATVCQDPELAGLWHGSSSEDCLIYLLPCEAVQRLCLDNAKFAERLQSKAGQRLRNGLTRLYQFEGDEMHLTQTPVLELLRRQAVTATADSSIRDAAQLMTGERVSSLLIVEADRLIGIVTDRDLRSRCLAPGLATSAPVSEIMSRDLTCLDHSASVFDAMLQMTYLNIHHLPVLNGTHLLGVVTHDDILHLETRHAVYLAAEIERAQNLDQLIHISEGLPQLQVRLIEDRHSAEQVGQVLSTILDSLTRRLLDLGQAELGEAPVAFCWFAMGSLARRETTVGSDQDHAMVLSEDYDDSRHADYFHRLANYVSRGLSQCGIPPCPGEMMASHRQWRKTPGQWRQTMLDWLRHPEEKAVMLASNFFDLRAVAGQAELLSPLRGMMQQEPRNHQGFMSALAMNTLSHRPPLGLFRNLVFSADEQHHPQLDLKAGGLMPALALARFYAIETGVEAVNTYERLRALMHGGELSAEGAGELLDAFALLGGMRARHQSAQIQHGLRPDNLLDPAEITALERQHLKDALQILRTQQQALRHRYLASGTR